MCDCHSWLKHLFLLFCPQREYIHPIPTGNNYSPILIHCIQLSVHGPPANYGTLLGLYVSSLGLVSKYLKKKKKQNKSKHVLFITLLPDTYDVLDFC